MLNLETFSSTYICTPGLHLESTKSNVCLHSMGGPRTRKGQLLRNMFPIQGIVKVDAHRPINQIKNDSGLNLTIYTEFGTSPMPVCHTYNHLRSPRQSLNCTLPRFFTDQRISPLLPIESEPGHLLPTRPNPHNSNYARVQTMNNVWPSRQWPAASGSNEPIPLHCNAVTP